MQARLLRIEGRVQAVGYRDWMVREANRLSLDGWVCNLGDGSVQALISGDEAAVEVLLTLARRGPFMARVSAITEAFADPPDEPGFHLK